MGEGLLSNLYFRTFSRWLFDYLAKANSPKYSVIANMAAVVGGHSVSQGHTPFTGVFYAPQFVQCNSHAFHNSIQKEGSIQ